MKNYRRQLATFLVLLAVNVNAQDKFEAYTQKVDGTQVAYEMKAISGGNFMMGSKNGKSDEQPLHRVSIEPFWMSKTEVTWDIFELFLYKDYEVAQSSKPISSTVDAVTRPTKPYLDMTFGMGKQNYPALAMTQYNAIQFCKWLYVKTGVFYRLPTEAEWEYACRAGSTEDYSFGKDTKNLGDYAWYSANSERKSHPVGEKKPNAFGLHDMHGNVAEWVYDQYIPDFYSTNSAAISKNPVAVPDKLYPLVVRGGAYDDQPDALRSAARKASDPAWKQIDPQIPKSNWWFPEAPFIGIRLVRPLKSPSLEEINAYYDKAPIKDY